jgi:hypothetical protein
VISRRAFRCLNATIVAFAVLFAQTAVLAYACQLEQLPSERAAVVPCPAHIEGAGDSSADGSANLCKVHCETPTTPDVPSVVGPAPAAFSLAYLAPMAVLQSPTAPLAPPGAVPPLILRTSRLLI